MIVIECILPNVLEFLQAVRIHVHEAQLRDGEKKPHPIFMQKYHSDVTVAYIRAANGLQELARVNATFFRILLPVMHQAKIATMHDRALLRVVKASPSIKYNYNIADMAGLGVMIGWHEQNNYYFWEDGVNGDLAIPRRVSRSGDIPWCLAMPPSMLGCGHIFQAYLTNEEKHIVSTLCDEWNVSIYDERFSGFLRRESCVELWE